MIGKEKKWKEKKVAFIFHVLELKENERKWKENKQSRVLKLGGKEIKQEIIIEIHL